MAFTQSTPLKEALSCLQQKSSRTTGECSEMDLPRRSLRVSRDVSVGGVASQKTNEAARGIDQVPNISCECIDAISH
jgi:hypothetical protein